MTSKCPTCKEPVKPGDNKSGRFFPFCSERCKLIDLGAWLEGQYRISAEGKRPEEEEKEQPRQN
ncbi:MAG: DNA gyrase inhibitor YacG [Phycisphaerae bacterium]